jgi:23S rRNA (adenine2503-C2)-methyltransferase
MSTQSNQPPTAAKVHLRDLSLPELSTFVTERGEPLYRYRQIASWMYGKLVDDFSVMSNLSLALRERLTAEAIVRSLGAAAEQASEVDGTRKFLFELIDGNLVESVLMPYEQRTTLCVSTQVGCPLDCVFCQTGKGVFGRNLTSGEILDQICYLKSQSDRPSDKVNVVFMGMGEPLLNFDALVKTIGVLNDAEALDMGSKRITVSTAGIPRRIRDLADAGLRCSLALSLNASSDELRRRLMPALGRYTIDELLEAAIYFYRKGARRVTLEYVLLGGVNTRPEDAERLGRLAARGPFKVNLIPYNPGHEADFEAMDEHKIERFIRGVLPYAPTVTVRRSKGPDIDAACGQLWTRSLSGKKKPAKGNQDSREEGSDWLLPQA